MKPNSIPQEFVPLSMRKKIFGIVVLSTFGHLARAQDFTDGFEAPSIDPYWTATTQFGSVSLSTDYTHIGVHAVKFASSSGGQRNIILSHSFASPTQGIFKVWY